MVKPTGGSDTQVVTFVNEGASSTTFTKYNGIELVNNPTTARKTTSIVHCKFSRTLSVPTTTTTSITAIDCSHTITITDCDKPELTPGAQWGVCGNKCAGDSAPGLYESCGGMVVTSTMTNTVMKAVTVPTCCTQCSQTLTCNTVSSTSIKRCEPPSPTPLLLANSMESQVDSFTHTSTLVLVGASAMVVAVALIVLKFRMGAAVGATEDQAVYYPLLE
ncbi:unnamed protein product [Phytophthora fragariaefolia]|uniref:Unnamed protein product n=1 Tax=Phytophthora fragariaefolia TaxID=1490495 RepID=A0A9W6YG75_9STRA|nr:unnamed protein product [Phytophthora fragariaefolia]